jgi:hypothetical protein
VSVRGKKIKILLADITTLHETNYKLFLEGETMALKEGFFGSGFY